MLCCFTRIRPLIGPRHLAIYHLSGSAVPIFLSTILNLGIVWVLLTVLLLLARKPGRLQVAVWSGLVLYLPWLLLQVGSLAGEWHLAHWLGVVLFIAPCVAWIAVMSFWRASFLPVFTRIRHAAQIFIGFAGFTAIIFVVQLFWCFWQARALNPPMATQPAPPAPRMAKSRVIWIILDELSYRQVYGRRFPGLKLPAFDSVAQQSTVFTHVIPAGAFTKDVLPSLMTGEPLDEFKSSADGTQLTLRNLKTGRRQRFDPHQTIFQDADDHGYRTAIAGWYIPYCRILPGVLSQCYWVFRSATVANMEGIKPHASTLADIVAPWRETWNDGLQMIRPRPQPPTSDPGHLADYHDLLSTGDRFLDDPSLTFLLLHMPIPHPGGIYDRRTGVFGTPGTSYIDNLALADLYLNHVHLLLQQRGEWDSATVVIMGDHSWRTNFFWASTPVWMPEDTAASDGAQFDDRPAYIVKLPYQNTPARIDEPFPALRTRALLNEVIAGKITCPSDLAAFAKLQPAN